MRAPDALAAAETPAARRGTAAEERAALEAAYLRPSAEGPAAEALHFDDQLLVAARPGRSRALSVVFCGVGHAAGGLQTPEFQAGAAAGAERHVVFVVDIRRSWWNAPGLAEAALDATGGYARAIGAEDVVAIGNSMGGFAAIAFAGALGARRAIAFSPQFSIDPEIAPGETRWPGHRARIETLRIRSLAETYAAAPDYLVFSGIDGAEAAELAPFAPVPNGVHALFARHGHGLAAALKAEGALRPLMAAALASERAPLLNLCADAGAFLRLTGRWRDAPGRAALTKGAD